MIPQELDLFPELTVAENLFVGRKRPRTGWGGLDWETMRGEARKRLDDLGVGLDATSAVKRLSAAEQQIVAIARALVGEAQAVIMDEPTSSLTERETRQLFGIIEDLTAEGVGVVYISHRLEEIFEISDRITVLRDGHHIKTAPASELDAEELVRLMVGRPLHELFTRSQSSPGETVLEVRGLTRDGEFEDVDLALRRGRFWASPGSSGPGVPSWPSPSSGYATLTLVKSSSMGRRPGSTPRKPRWRGGYSTYPRSAAPRASSCLSPSRTTLP